MVAVCSCTTQCYGTSRHIWTVDDKSLVQLFDKLPFLTVSEKHKHSSLSLLCVVAVTNG